MKFKFYIILGLFVLISSQFNFAEAKNKADAQKSGDDSNMSEQEKSTTTESAKLKTNPVVTKKEEKKIQEIFPNAAELLKESDRSRGAAASTQGLTWIAKIKSTEDGDTNEVQYIIKVLGDDAIAEVTAPPRQKGEVILFNDRTLWYYKPGIKKPVSLSARQKLMGEAANGDIASTQYVRDYNGEVVGSENLNSIDCWKLILKAKAKNVTYDKINYWIAKKDKLAMRAEFLTIAGDPFKYAEFKYTNSLQIKGQNYPFVSEMKIMDFNNKQNLTVIEYEKPKEDKHAPQMFNVNNLVK